MAGIFEKLGHTLANIRDSYHFSVPARAMRENNMAELGAWLSGANPNYEETTNLLFSAPSIESAAAVGRHLRDQFPSDYRNLLNSYIDHIYETQQGRQPGNPSNLNATRSGLILLGMLQSMAGTNGEKQSSPTAPAEGFISFDQEIKLMQISDERAYQMATDYSPPIKHFVDYRPLLDLEAQSFGRFCRIGVDRHSGLDPRNPPADRASSATVNSFKGNLINMLADHLTTSTSPRFDLVEAGLQEKLFTTEELIFAVSVHSPRHLNRPTASYSSSTEAVGARINAKNQIIERFATADTCLKEVAKLTYSDQLDPAYRKKLNSLYQADPSIVEKFRKQPEDLVRHLDGYPARIPDIAALNSPVAQYTRILTALKAGTDAPKEKDKFCLELLGAMQPSQPLHHLVETYGHSIWESATAHLSPSHQELSSAQDKNWRFHAAQKMNNPRLTLAAAQSIARSSISEHYELTKELVESNEVNLVRELCDRNDKKPQSRVTTTEAMILGELTHTAHRPLLAEKAISAEMLDVIIPNHITTTSQHTLDQPPLVRRLQSSSLVDKILDNVASAIPPEAKVGMLGVLLRKTGADIKEESLEKMLSGTSALKSQMLVQLVKSGSPGTRKNLLVVAANCPDEAVQETIIDEILTRPLVLEEEDLEKFGNVSPRSKEMLEKAIAASQLTLPAGRNINFDQGPQIE